MSSPEAIWCFCNLLHRNYCASPILPLSRTMWFRRVCCRGHNLTTTRSLTTTCARGTSFRWWCYCPQCVPLFLLMEVDLWAATAWRCLGQNGCGVIGSSSLAAMTDDLWRVARVSPSAASVSIQPAVSGIERSSLLHALCSFMLPFALLSSACGFARCIVSVVSCRCGIVCTRETVIIVFVSAFRFGGRSFQSFD